MAKNYSTLTDEELEAIANEAFNAVPTTATPAEAAAIEQPSRQARQELSERSAEPFELGDVARGSRSRAGDLGMGAAQRLVGAAEMLGIEGARELRPKLDTVLRKKWKDEERLRRRPGFTVGQGVSDFALGAVPYSALMAMGAPGLVAATATGGGAGFIEPTIDNDPLDVLINTSKGAGSAAALYGGLNAATRLINGPGRGVSRPDYAHGLDQYAREHGVNLRPGDVEQAVDRGHSLRRIENTLAQNPMSGEPRRLDLDASALRQFFTVPTGKLDLAGKPVTAHRFAEDVKRVAELRRAQNQELWDDFYSAASASPGELSQIWAPNFKLALQRAVNRYLAPETPAATPKTMKQRLATLGIRDNKARDALEKILEGNRQKFSFDELEAARKAIGTISRTMGKSQQPFMDDFADALNKSYGAIKGDLDNWGLLLERRGQGDIYGRYTKALNDYRDSVIGLEEHPLASKLLDKYKPPSFEDVTRLLTGSDRSELESLYKLLDEPGQRTLGLATSARRLGQRTTAPTETMTDVRSPYRMAVDTLTAPLSYPYAAMMRKPGVKQMVFTYPEFARRGIPLTLERAGRGGALNVLRLKQESE